MSDVLVRVEHVSKKFCRNLRRSLWYGVRDLGSELVGRQRNHETLRHDEFWAVDDVSFELRRGECLGLIGHNGAGKTTLLRMLNGLITPDRGRIEMHGRVGALIALGAGFNPVLSGRENIYVNAAVLGFSKRETDRRFDEIVAFSDLEEFIDSPVQHYSSGMYLRLGFSVAAHLEPAVLLVDEALAVGDTAYVVKSLNRIAYLRRQGTGVVFVTHNELQLREAANSCLLLHRGRLQALGALETVWPSYEELRSNARAETLTDPGYVHDGVLRIESIDIGDASQPICGNPLTIKLLCTASTPISAVGLELRFWSSSGQIVTSIHSKSYHHMFDFPAGTTEIQIEIESLGLAPGRYRLAGGFRREGEILGWSQDLATMQMVLPTGMETSEGMVMTFAGFSSRALQGAER